MTPCPRCHHATLDGLLCDLCTRVYRRALEDLDRYLPELAVTVSREDAAAKALVHGRADRSLELAAVEAAEARAVPARLRTRDAEIALPSHALPVNMDAAVLWAEVRELLAELLTMLGGRLVRPSDRLGGGTAQQVDLLAGPTCPPHFHDFRPDGCGLRTDPPCRQMHPDHVHDYSPRGCGWRDCKIRLHCRHESCRAIRAGTGTVGRRALSWLAGATAVGVLRGHEQAAGVVDRLQRAARRVETAVDRRDPELFLGICDTPDVAAELDEATGVVTVDVDSVCGAQLYARPGDDQITCQVCGWTYRVADRRAAMLDAVRDVLARPKTIADALTSLDLPVNAATLDLWISRDKKLHGQGRERRDGLPLILADPVTDWDGKPLYRVGAIIDRVEALRAVEDETA